MLMGETIIAKSFNVFFFSSCNTNQIGFFLFLGFDFDGLTFLHFRGDH